MSNKKTDRKSDISVLDRDDRKVEKPKKYKAVMHNDDYTPMDVVVHILMEIFRKPFEEAMRLMLDVHHKDRGVAGVYTKEICDTKCLHANKFARDMGYPFLVTPEEE